MFSVKSDFGIVITNQILALGENPIFDFVLTFDLFSLYKLVLAKATPFLFSQNRHPRIFGTCHFLYLAGFHIFGAPKGS